MRQETRNKMKKIMTLEETHNWVDEAIEDFEYKVKSARNPNNKRKSEWTLNLFKSMKKHLKPIPNENPEAKIK
jgi:hypothetical protein